MPFVSWGLGAPAAALRLRKSWTSSNSKDFLQGAKTVCSALSPATQTESCPLPRPAARQHLVLPPVTPRPWTGSWSQHRGSPAWTGLAEGGAPSTQAPETLGLKPCPGQVEEDPRHRQRGYPWCSRSWSGAGNPPVPGACQPLVPVPAYLWARPRILLAGQCSGSLAGGSTAWLPHRPPGSCSWLVLTLVPALAWAAASRSDR